MAARPSLPSPSGACPAPAGGVAELVAEGDGPKGLSSVPYQYAILETPEIPGVETPALAFPTAQLVSAAASMFGRGPVWDGAEGRQFTFTISPGTVGVAMSDPARQERNNSDGLGNWSALRAGMVLDGEGDYWSDEDGPAFHDAPRTRQAVTSWSSRSRARMTRRLAQLDWTPMYEEGRPPAMVTLTYSADWLTVAPSGKAVKKHLKALMMRYQRRWGKRAVFVWKLEFQRRGAPHLHLLMVLPADPGFREWLSEAWAAVVAHPDPEERRRHRMAGTGVDYVRGGRCFDPKRSAVYFSKHGGAAGGKEYQHVVPVEWQEPGKGPGRFWGFEGLKPATATVTVEVREYVQLRRTLRRISEARSMTRQQRVPRVNTTTGEVSWRTVTRRRRYLGHGGMAGGTLLVNDGPAVASALARMKGSG